MAKAQARGNWVELDRWIRERAKAEGFAMNRTQALARLIKLAVPPTAKPGDNGEAKDA